MTQSKTTTPASKAKFAHGQVDGRTREKWEPAPNQPMHFARNVTDPQSIPFQAELDELQQSDPQLAAATLRERFPSDADERAEALAAIDRKSRRRSPIAKRTKADPLDAIRSARINDAMGTRSEAWAKLLVRQLSDLGDLEAGLAFMNGLEPANELEASLGVQIYAAHCLSMRMMREALQPVRPERQQLYADLANKSARTVTALAEGLAKIRNGGKQRVEVVYVDARNSQNIIGGQTGERRGGQSEIWQQPLGYRIASLAFAPVAPVWRPQSSGPALQGPSDASQETLRLSRRQEPRCAEGTEERTLSPWGPSPGGEGSPALSPASDRPGSGHAQ